MNSYLAIDITPERCTATIGSFTNKGIETQLIHSFANEPISLFGRLYWDLLYMYSGVIEALRKAARSGVEIKSIGITSFGFDFCCFGSDGLILSPPRAFVGITDNSLTANYYSRVNKSDLYKRIAAQDQPYKTLFQLDTMQRSGSASLSAANKILFISDTITYMLTGVMVSEETIAGSSGIVNVTTQCLDQKVLMSVGLTPQNFGVFVSPGMTIGRLSDQVQRLTGLGNVPIVAVAGHDVASAVLASPEEPDDAAFSYAGYNCVVGIETEGLVVGPAAEAAGLTNSKSGDGRNLVYRVTGGGRLLRKCFSEWGDTYTPDEVSKMINSATSMHSLIDPDSEAFSNPDQMSRVMRQMCERTAQRPPADKAEVLKCLALSVANRHTEVLRTILSAAHTTVNKLVALGSDPSAGILLQMVSDMTGLEVVLGPPNPSTLGNIMVQAVAAGEVINIGEARHIVAPTVATQTFQPR